MNFTNKPKKSLGQNFLTSEWALQKIVETADIKKDDTILEVGPGKGALTAEILKCEPKKVLAIEKDDSMIPLLQETFHKNIEDGSFILENGDILEFDPDASFLSSPARSGIHVLEKGYKIVANIPYYITGHFIRKFLTADNKPSKMVLLIQKEVAERIVAKNGKESLLSLSVKAYGEPKYIMTVNKGSFFPAPNVDSAIIEIDLSQQPINNHFISKEEEQRFFDILHAGFTQKRKMILGNLAEIFGGREKTEEKLKNCGIDPKSRAEDMKLGDWKCLSTWT